MPKFSPVLHSVLELDSELWVGISVLSRNLNGLTPTLTVTLSLSQHQP